MKLYTLLLTSLSLAVGVAQELVLFKSELTSVALGGQLVDTTLDYIVNTADPRAGGKDTVTMTYSIPKQAWVAIGFTNNGGLMVGSEAVIGLPDTGQVLKYNMNSKLNEGVVPMPDAQQTLIETSIEQDESLTIMRFTKILNEEGEIPIVIGGNTFLGAYGFDNNLFYHERRDSFAVDLVAGEVAVVETRKKTLWKAHGYCAALAWGVFSPLAIGAAVLRYWFPNGLWFKMHQYLNMGVIVLTVFAFAFAVAAIQSENLSHFSPSPSPHRLVGLIVVILAVAQTFGGIFRPHATEPGEKPTSTRRAFEIGHRILGLTLLLMAWYQVASGIGIYQRLFVDSVDAPLTGIFWGVVGSIFGIVLVGRVFAIFAAKNAAKKESESDDVPTNV